MTENRTSSRRAGKIARAQQGGAVGGGFGMRPRDKCAARESRGGIEQEWATSEYSLCTVAGGASGENRGELRGGGQMIVVGAAGHGWAAPRADGDGVPAWRERWLRCRSTLG